MDKTLITNIMYYIDTIEDPLLIYSDVSFIIRDGEDNYNINDSQITKISDNDVFRIMRLDKFGFVKGRTFINHDHTYIFIDMNQITNEYPYVIAHELRHVYQREQVTETDKNKIFEPKEIIDIWKRNISNYDGSETSEYALQDIEIDANAFALYMLNSLFGMRMNKIVGEDTDGFKSCMYHMNMSYTMEDIKESCEYNGFNPKSFDLVSSIPS